MALARASSLSDRPFGESGDASATTLGNEERRARLAELIDRPSENLFARVARDMPGRLFEAIDSGLLHNADLSLAAEVLGRTHPEAHGVAHKLVELMEHPSPVVREGAVMGLGHSRVPWPDVVRALKTHSQEEREASRAVRTAAADALDAIE